MKNNVVLIIIDTLRKDYAEHLKNTLEKLGFISYENAIAPAPWTVPSHASIFTGLYPIFHGAHVIQDRRLLSYRIRTSIQKLMIQHILKNLGYTNYLYTANPYITPFFGYNKFDYVEEIDPFWGVPVLKLNRYDEEKLNKIRSENDLKTLINLLKNKEMRLLCKLTLGFISTRFWRYCTPVKHLYRKMINWPKDKGISKFIKKIRTLNFKEPAFIFINFMEMHEPYLIKDLFHNEMLINLRRNIINKELVKIWLNRYSNHATYVRNKIIELIKIFEEKKLFDNSLIIITSDHGQLLGEHDRLGHGIFLYDELLKVPLFIKYPQNIDLKISEKEGYISLIKLKKLILSTIKNTSFNDEVLYSNLVFAESYGVHLDVGKNLSPIEIKNIENLNTYKIAIYSGEFKGIFNVNKWNFEEITTYHKEGSELREEIVRSLRGKIIRFLSMSLRVKTRITK